MGGRSPALHRNSSLRSAVASVPASVWRVETTFPPTSKSRRENCLGFPVDCSLSVVEINLSHRAGVGVGVAGALMRELGLQNPLVSLTVRRVTSAFSEPGRQEPRQIGVCVGGWRKYSVLSHLTELSCALDSGLSLQRQQWQIKICLKNKSPFHILVHRTLSELLQEQARPL